MLLIPREQSAIPGRRASLLDEKSADASYSCQNTPGAWAIHPILILIGKFVFDSIPGVGSDLSWTLVTCGYMAVSYLIFHQMTGLPFENTCVPAVLPRRFRILSCLGRHLP